jgi:nitrate reductase (cytochrome), electron transfer subunit
MTTNQSISGKLRSAAALALAVALVWMGVQLAPVQAQANGEVVKMKSLRGGTPLKQDNPPSASHQERDHAPQPRDFLQQPPLIPHTTSGYQVTRNFNKCMDCHAWSKAAANGATKVGLTHFRDREGMELDNVSPRRYFCTQCHVAQTDAKPLVENTFQRARGLQ